LTEIEEGNLISSHRTQISVLKNEINSLQASILAIEKYFNYDLEFTVTNAVVSLEQLDIPVNVTSTIRPAMDKGRLVFNQRVAQLDKLLDEERVKLDDLDLALFISVEFLRAPYDAFKIAMKEAADFYNSVKQTEARVMLAFLVTVKRSILDKVVFK